MGCDEGGRADPAADTPSLSAPMGFRNPGGGIPVSFPDGYLPFAQV